MRQTEFIGRPSLRFARSYVLEMPVLQCSVGNLRARCYGFCSQRACQRINDLLREMMKPFTWHLLQETKFFKIIVLYWATIAKFNWWNLRRAWLGFSKVNTSTQRWPQKMICCKFYPSLEHEYFNKHLIQWQGSTQPRYVHGLLFCWFHDIKTTSHHASIRAQCKTCNSAYDDRDAVTPHWPHITSWSWDEVWTWKPETHFWAE